MCQPPGAGRFGRIVAVYCTATGKGSRWENRTPRSGELLNGVWETVSARWASRDWSRRLADQEAEAIENL
jgi:hypothetical protein